MQIPGVIWLMRAPAADEAFTDAANWEWFTGFDESQNPQWGVMEDRAPVSEDPDGVMHGSAIYVPGIDLFLMSTNHTQVVWFGPGRWNSAKFNVPEPSGPSLWLAGALALGACSRSKRARRH